MQEPRPRFPDNAQAAELDYLSAPSGRIASGLLGKRERDYSIDQHLALATYELGDSYMHISDPVWGEEYIGDKPYDPLLLELARTPLFRRLQAIEQLTLGVEYATMPNSMYFSRWQHAWGSTVFVRKMLEGREDIDDRQKAVLQLRTLLSDVGHTAFSHLGDWMFQGTNGGEDLHDQDLKDILHVSGIDGILRRYGLTTEETVFPDVKDWVECPSPDLCVDRVDYGFREILRWGVPTIPLHMCLQALENPQSVFEINGEGQLLMKDQQMARYFAAGFSLLPTEHWSHPIHRMQLQLFQSAVRSSAIEKVRWNGMHPREAFYGIDTDFSAHFRSWDMLHLESVMRQTAVMQRRIFIEARRDDLNHVFRGIEESGWEFPEFPDPLKSYAWQSEAFGKPYPANVVMEEIDAVAVEAMRWDDRGLILHLPPLKARAIDPLVKAGNSTVFRLSELEPSYMTYLQGQRDTMARSYRATILMRPDVAARIVEEHAAADTQWAGLLRRKRNPQNLHDVIQDAERYAAARPFDNIHEVDDEKLAEAIRRLRLRTLGSQGIAGASA